MSNEFFGGLLLGWLTAGTLAVWIAFANKYTRR